MHDFIIDLMHELYIHAQKKDKSEGRPVYEIPGRREFFKDIDYVLNAIRYPV